MSSLKCRTDTAKWLTRYQYFIFCSYLPWQTCHKCHQQGHVSKDCQSNQKSNSSQHNESNSVQVTRKDKTQKTGVEKKRERRRAEKQLKRIRLKEKSKVGMTGRHCMSAVKLSWYEGNPRMCSNISTHTFVKENLLMDYITNILYLRITLLIHKLHTEKRKQNNISPCTTWVLTSVIVETIYFLQYLSCKRCKCIESFFLYSCSKKSLFGWKHLWTLTVLSEGLEGITEVNIRFKFKECTVQYILVPIKK